jgi:hypothetical protein
LAEPLLARTKLYEKLMVGETAVVIHYNNPIGLNISGFGSFLYKGVSFTGI